MIKQVRNERTSWFVWFVWLVSLVTYFIYDSDYSPSLLNHCECVPLPPVPHLGQRGSVVVVRCGSDGTCEKIRE